MRCCTTLLNLMLYERREFLATVEHPGKITRRSRQGRLELKDIFAFAEAVLRHRGFVKALDRRRNSAAAIIGFAPRMTRSPIPGFAASNRREAIVPLDPQGSCGARSLGVSRLS